MVDCGKCIREGCPNQKFCDDLRKAVDEAVSNLAKAVEDDILRSLRDEMLSKGQKALDKMRKRHVADLYQRV